MVSSLIFCRFFLEVPIKVAHPSGGRDLPVFSKVVPHHEVVFPVDGNRVYEVTANLRADLAGLVAGDVARRRPVRRTALFFDA